MYIFICSSRLTESETLGLWSRNLCFESTSCNSRSCQSLKTTDLNFVAQCIFFGNYMKERLSQCLIHSRLSINATLKMKIFLIFNANIYDVYYHILVSLLQYTQE